MNQHQKDALLNLQNLAKSLGGELLSDTYTVAYDNYKFRCDCGKEWESSVLKIFNKKFCPACKFKEKKIRVSTREKIRVSTREKITIETLQENAATHDGYCLSEKYIRTNSIYRWKCKDGHEWDAPASRIRMGIWCMKCFRKRRRFTIEVLQKKAASHNGKCLSTEYKGAHGSHDFECSKGHTWTARAADILNKNSWCKLCKGKTLAIRLKKVWEDAQILRDIAKDAGGKTMSRKFKGMNRIYSWKCANNHNWRETAQNIKDGKWCPKCSKDSPS